MISTLQDAIEERNVVTLDIPRAFLIIRFTGKMVEWSAKIVPKICSDVIYGCLKSAYLFYFKLKADLTSWGFKENPYDGCTLNKTFTSEKTSSNALFNGMWMISKSCKNNRVIKSVVQRLKELYGKTAPLTISTGKVHEYLGMEIDSSKKGKVTYSQYDYINKIFFSVSKYKDMQGESPTPACPHLFQNDDEAAVLLP